MTTRVRLPHERLAALWPQELVGCRLGAVVHPASILPDLSPLADLLKAPGQPWKLAALFGPQHGILGHTQDNMIEWEGEADPRWGVPVHSLYGRVRKPTPPMLAGLDALLIDLQDVGARYYTFIWTLKLCMEAAWEQGLAVVVPDRPNPLGGVVEGPMLEDGFQSFVGLHTVPVRHGLTMGEMARLLVAECFPGLRLFVLPMEGYRSGMTWEETLLPWVLPSPNMPTPDTARVYPGMCLLEACTVSEGRGTTRPFEIFGAPWIDSQVLKSHLDSLHLPGVVFREMGFQPTFHKGVGRLCSGVQIHVTNAQLFRPVLTGWAILWALRQQALAQQPIPIDPLHPEGLPDLFGWKAPPYEYEEIKLPIDILAGGSRWRERLEAGATPYELEQDWIRDYPLWEQRCRDHRLYPQ
ncbi:MAG: DUF1343 domain-containing protein [Fibrobacteria bacterium]|nr:DUF1343 domain-containing protein [Fibrobacteria bacterium]